MAEFISKSAIDKMGLDEFNRSNRPECKLSARQRIQQRRIGVGARMPKPRGSGRIAVPLSWGTVTGAQISETDLLDQLRHFRREPLLSALVKLLQYLDAPVHQGAQQRELDGLLPRLFPGPLGRQAYTCLRNSDRWIFLSKWQLLFAIKLLCTFGSNAQTLDRLDPSQTLRLLLMVNSFYPNDPGSPYSDDDDVKQVQSVALRGYALPAHERPTDLIARYAEMYDVLGAPTNEGAFSTWVNVHDVVADKLGFDLGVFKAVLFAIFANATPVHDGENEGFPFGTMDPEAYFASTRVPQDTLSTVLDWVTIDPDGIRKDHLSTYDENIGNPVDLGLLLRKPVIRLPNGRLAGMSGEMVVQRYTSGLYWDINDALASDDRRQPNRSMFWTFFGELHERYGRDVLLRIVDRQRKAGKNAALLSDQDYASGPGSKPDNVVVETIGTHNTRVTMFEFKVGRPRYQDSIVKGDVEAFERDLRKKIETGLDQEIDLFRRLISGTQSLSGMPIENVSKWFFVIVVTDPFPSTGLFLGPLRQKLSEVEGGVGVKLYGPYILSLSELEQLEALSEKRVSDLLNDWTNGPDKEWPFNTFFYSRTKGQPLKVDRMAELATPELQKSQQLLFSFAEQVSDELGSSDDTSA